MDKKSAKLGQSTIASEENPFLTFRSTAAGEEFPFLTFRSTVASEEWVFLTFSPKNTWKFPT